NSLTLAIIAASVPMKKTSVALFVCVVVTLVNVSGAVEYQAVAEWLKLPAGKTQLGSMHGDIAVSSRDEVYVSVETENPGLQVFAPDGRFLRSVPNAPPDLHGFVIRRQA